MADFNDEHKAERGKYFEEGVHKVEIIGVEGGTNDNGKEYIEFKVGGADGEEGTARMWFTTDKAIGFTFDTIRTIFVHNAKEGKKEEAREMVNKVKNSDELVKLCATALNGKEAWYVVERSDYTYTNAAGEQKQGYNRNLYGYEPKPRQPKVPTAEELMQGLKDDGAEPFSSEDIPDVF